MMVIRSVNQHAHMIIQNDDTDQLRRIITDIAPDVLLKFAKKNNQYGENSFDLGIRGQFSDMHRKYALLRKAMWDAPDEELEFESLEEVLGDMIGHCLLSLDLLRQQRGTTPEPGRCQWSKGDGEEGLEEMDRLRCLMREGHENDGVFHVNMNGDEWS